MQGGHHQSSGMCETSLESLESLDSLSLESLERLSARLESQGRPALLAHLKECGVDRLPERQKVANAVAKHMRGLALPPRLAHVPLPPLALQPEGVPPERWRVWSSGWQAIPPQQAAACPPPTLPALSHVIVVDDVMSREECAHDRGDTKIVE